MRRAASLLLVGAVAVAGCGESEKSPEAGDRLTKDEYEREFKSVIERFEGSGESLPKFDEQAQPEQQAAAFAAYQGHMRNLAAELGRLRPPGEAASAHADYVAGLRGIADDMQRIVDLLRKGDQAGAEALLDSPTGFASPRNIELAGRARLKFQELGYDLGIESLPGGAGP